MPLEFSFCHKSKRWSASKVSRKWETTDHRGVAHYDKQRLKGQLPPRQFDFLNGGTCDNPNPPLGIKRFGGWEWGEITVTRRTRGWNNRGTEETVEWGYKRVSDNADRAESTATAVVESSGYKIEPCCITKYVTYGFAEPKHYGPPNAKLVTYTHKLTFTTGETYHFTSQSVATTALAELLKIRKSKHRQKTWAGHSGKNDLVFFKERKLRQLAS